jgi:hypothetical protein
VNVAMTVSPAPVTSATWSVPKTGMSSGSVRSRSRAPCRGCLRDQHCVAVEALLQRQRDSPIFSSPFHNDVPAAAAASSSFGSRR